MKLMFHASRVVVAVSLSLAAFTPTLAQDMVSVKSAIVNMRAGPSTRADVLWELDQGYPL